MEKSDLIKTIFFALAFMWIGAMVYSGYLECIGYEFPINEHGETEPLIDFTLYFLGIIVAGIGGYELRNWIKKKLGK